MKKLDLIFSTTDKNGDRATEKQVRHLMAGFADLHGVEGYTLNKALTGYWQGKEEDSYMITVISFTNEEYIKNLVFIMKLSDAIKGLFHQDETLIIKSDVDAL